MKKLGLLSHIVKTAQISEFPFWVHVPGLPFTLPGTITQKERLPGMNEWLPRPLIERVAKGMRQGASPEELAELEAKSGLLSNVGVGGGIGAASGALGARLLGGEAASAPFKNILKRGLTGQTLKGLGKLPLSAKILPALGLTGGAGLAALRWMQREGERKRQAQAVAEGLLTESRLRSNALQKLPVESASVQAPTAVTTGNTGV